MENFQVICLAAGAVLLAYRFFVTGNRAERIFLSGLLCLFVTFLLLEADTRKTGLPSWLIKITNGRIRDLWLGGLWLVCGFFFMRHFKTVWDCFLAWLRRPAGKFMLVAGGFWIISAAIDKSTGATKSLFAEELMEVNATTLMLASAWLTARRQETQSASASASN